MYELAWLTGFSPAIGHSSCSCAAARTAAEIAGTSSPRIFSEESGGPEDEEMDQRLRGRLAVMARFNAYMSWERVLNKDAVLWPYNLLAWETTWSMGCFVRQLEQVRAAAVPAFQEAERRVHELLGPREPWPISTNEYAVPRSGQIDRRRANGAPNPKRSRANAE